MNEPFVSVVTPIYNTGRYLEEAIQSVLAQTHRNFEYIICNNHSTDNTAEIAARYAALDARIRVIQPPRFLPQDQNFNFALQHIAAESRYTKLVLADDWLFPNCLQEMTARAAMSPKTGVVSAYRLIEAQGDGFGLPVDKKIISGRAACRLFLVGGVYMFGTPSTVMYSSEVVRERAPQFYPEGRFYFDTDAIFQILADHDFGFVHQVLTFTRYQPDSITFDIRDYASRDIDRVLLLHHYGRQYLESDEYERATSASWRVYYEKLGRQWLRDRIGRKSPGFWKFHEARLSSIGMRIERRRLAAGAALALARTATSPGDAAAEFIRSRRRREKPWENA